MRSLVLTALFVSIAAVAGCSDKGKAGDLGQAVTDYNQGKFSNARDTATHAMSASNGAAKDDAAYLAGLSAYQLGDRDEAERRWLAASDSTNEETAASSKAMLGQLRLEQHRPREAAELLADASSHLKGDDSKQAASRAGIAFQQAGDDANAKKWIALGGGAVGTTTTNKSTGAAPSAKSGSSSSLPSSSPFSANGYSLQVGAFSEIRRAQRAADDADRIAKKEGIGPVRMFSKHDDRGKAFYIVQVGNFATRDAAAAARSKLGKLEYIVAPAAGPAMGFASAG